MPRHEIEAVALSAINDCAILAAGFLELQNLVAEARKFLKISDCERADKRLAEAPPISGDSPTSVPAGVVLQ